MCLLLLEEIRVLQTKEDQVVQTNEMGMNDEPVPVASSTPSREDSSGRPT